MRNLEVLEHQAEVLLDTTHRFIGLVGGYRSGKTHVLCIKAIQLALANTELPGIICEPTHGMITRVLIPTMNDILYNLGIRFNLNKSEASYDIWFDEYAPRKIWLLSSENYQRAAGISASYFLMDEVDLMKKHIAFASFNMLVSRLTRGEQMQGVCVSTPEGFSFLYEFFEEDKDDNKVLYRASTYDNPFIDESYFENMAKTHTSQQLEAYLKGYFVNLTSGQVYYAFDRLLNATYKDITLCRNSDQLLIGIDFNVNVMASVVGVYEQSTDSIHIIDEIQGCKNTEALIYTIQQRYPNRIINVYPDATGKASKSCASMSDIALLKQAGFKVFARNSNPFVKDRVASTNGALCNSLGIRRLFINISKSPLLVKGLEQQGYDKSGEPDKSGGLDHMLDGLGYMIHWIFPITGKPSASVH
jgi:hypothetical protein